MRDDRDRRIRLGRVILFRTRRNPCGSVQVTIVICIGTRSCLDNSRYGRARYDLIRDAGGISCQSPAFVPRQTGPPEDSKGASRPLTNPIFSRGAGQISFCSSTPLAPPRLLDLCPPPAAAASTADRLNSGSDFPEFSFEC